MVKSKIISFGVCCLLIGILFVTSCFAQDIDFDVTVDKTQVSLGKSVQLSLVFEGTQDISAPDLPDIEGFEWHYLGPSTSISIVNNKVSKSIIHKYRLISRKVGLFIIPSFTIQFDGKNYTSDSITIEVVAGRAAKSSQPEERREQGDSDSGRSLDDRIFLIMQTDKRKAYVNEIIPLTIKLYVNSLSVRDIQFPEFSHEGFSVDKFVEPKQYQEILNGIPYDVIEFSTDVFGLRPGELNLGPAQIQCNLIVKKNSSRRSVFDDNFFGSDFFTDFFGGHEAHPLSLKSVNIPIIIQDLPTDNVPADYNGALGDFRFYLEAEPKEIKVGDPITLKMTIAGEGNFRTVNPPVLNFGSSFKIYDPEIEQSDIHKVFEQVLMPKNENISEIPKVKFSFFDTKTNEYREITRGPILIKVNPLPKGEEFKVFEIPEADSLIRRREILGRDIIYIKDNSGNLRIRGEYLCRNRPFITIQIIPLLALISILFLQRRRERIKTDVRYARLLRAPRKAKKNLHLLRQLLNSKEPAIFFDAVFKTLREYLGDKFHLASAGITSNVVEEELRFRNIDKEMLEKIRECFNSCDTARYAASTITKEQMANTFRLIQEIIDHLERIRV